MKIGYKKAFIITVAALILLGGLNIYSIWATNGGSFTVPKPWTEELIPSYPIEIIGITFTYEATNDIYTKCEVSVKNKENIAKNAQVTVQLKTTAGIVLALTKTDHTTTVITPSGTGLVTLQWTVAEWTTAECSVSDLTGANVIAWIYVP